MIEVKQLDEEEPMSFQVTVREVNSETRHQVTMSRQDYMRLSAEKAPPDVFVRSAFAFLLEREPKEAILSHFDIMVISRYFPDFERAFPAACLPETSKP